MNNDELALLASYAKELRETQSDANAWWEDRLAEEQKVDGDREAALSRLRQRWPFGPVSHPWVIAVFRKYYLLCEQHRKEHGGNGILPRVFTYELLSGGNTNDLYEFISGLAFVPIGMKDDELV